MTFDTYNMPGGKVYARPLKGMTVSTGDYLKEMNAATTVTPADGMAALAYLSEFLTRHLQAGDTVSLDGIGSFSLSLTVKEEAREKEGKTLTGRDVTLKRITFRAAPRLKNAVEDGLRIAQVEKERRRLLRHNLNLDERRAVAVKLAEEKGEFTVSDYQKATGICRPMTYGDLRQFAAEGAIAERRFGRMKIYAKA